MSVPVIALPIVSGSEPYLDWIGQVTARVGEDEYGYWSLVIGHWLWSMVGEWQANE